MSDLKNKVVIITGASSGIGKACAEEFAKEKCKVVMTGRNAANLSAAAYEIRKKYSADSSKRKRGTPDLNILAIGDPERLDKTIVGLKRKNTIPDLLY